MFKITQLNVSPKNLDYPFGKLIAKITVTLNDQIIFYGIGVVQRDQELSLVGGGEYLIQKETKKLIINEFKRSYKCQKTN